jgi:hypothetical protein
MLRDTQGIATVHATVPLELVPIVARMNGARTCEQIARDVSAETREHVPVDLVVRLASELEEALFVDGPPYRREHARVAREFAEAAVRPASHAGGAYHGEPHKLAEYIEHDCFRSAAPSGAPGSRDGRANGGRLVALVAPHIDPWRGARCYGHAYGVLARSIPPHVDTFVLFGTSHAPMREPFALCRKAFDTPLGALEADLEAIDTIAKACDFDPYADELNHKREHSLEFQVVFLRHLLAGRPARIVPILAGLGEHQSSGESPRSSRSVERFLDSVRRVVDDRGAVVVAGADLAHVGPRFGDPRPLDDEERARLDATDRESISHATTMDHEGFWSHVARDLDTRRVCGLAPIWSLLRTIDPRAKGALSHYEQTVDADEGSIVSHAALGFYA